MNSVFGYVKHDSGAINCCGPEKLKIFVLNVRVSNVLRSTIERTVKMTSAVVSGHNTNNEAASALTALIISKKL